MSINERIEKLIETLKVNQSELAKICDVSKQAVSSILRGDTKPSLKVIENIVKYYPLLNSRWLITGEGDPFPGAGYNSANENLQLNDSKDVYNCDNCKRLESYIERQERLIVRLERQLGHDTENKKVV